MPPTPRCPPPGRLFFGVFSGFDELLGWARQEIESAFGALDAELESAVLPFPETRAYSRSMGPDLKRQFFFLLEPFPQDGLAAVKRRTLEIEARARSRERWAVERPLNIDPGILNDCRVILASTKDHSHRLYRGQGIWEEITLVYRRPEGGGPAAFQALPWTYPDFRQASHRELFERARRKHLEFLRALGEER
jgi:hypothetical protein